MEMKHAETTRKEEKRRGVQVRDPTYAERIAYVGPSRVISNIRTQLHEDQGGLTASAIIDVSRSANADANHPHWHRNITLDGEPREIPLKSRGVCEPLFLFPVRLQTLSCPSDQFPTIRGLQGVSVGPSCQPIPIGTPPFADNQDASITCTKG